jgi:uncharacterized protein YggU (UPF0235/DUF167 family)
MADLEIAVTARASSEGVGPFHDGLLRVRVTRPPSDGEANRAVLRVLGRALDVAPSRLELLAGERQRRKRIRVHGLDADELARRLGLLGAD